jgi:selenocysteine-specific translation elongation factor
MKHVTIGIFHDEKLGNELGKKGTESDILMFNRKTDDRIFSFMSPLEDKLTTKAQIISTIDAAIIYCEQITPEIGETILLLDSVGINEGIFVSPEYTDTTHLVNMIKDTSLKNFILIDRNITKIIELLGKIDPERDLSSPAIVITDHSFSVKGIGEIILGVVKQGTINKHDSMILLPANKEVIIRSIQMQDRDFDNATAGCRVGLAIKGATVEEMKRGSIFSTPDGAKTDKKFILHFIKNRFYQEVKKGVFYAIIGMQSVPITITEITENTITIETEKPVCYTKNDTFILLDLNAKKLRHIGNGKIV